MEEPDLTRLARSSALAMAHQTGIDMSPESVTIETVLEDSRSGTATPDGGEIDLSASAAEVGPAPAKKKKKKPRKNKSKSQKALAIGTGFEEYYADNPVRPEEWAQERNEYDPTKHSFRERIDACLVRYKKKRFLDKNRARIFQVYLSFAKIYKPKAENQKVGGEAETLDEDGNAEDGQMLQTSGLGGYDEVLDAEDLSLRSRKFFAHHLPFELFLTREAPLQEAITVVENFVRYLLFHEVCPEFNSALHDTLHFAKLSRTELPAAVKLINVLPGYFNTAVSFLLGGQFGHHNPSLPDHTYDRWLDTDVGSDMLTGTGDAIPIDVSAEIAKHPKGNGHQEVADDNKIGINSKEQETLFEFKDDLDLSELENLSGNENDVSDAEAGHPITNGHTNGNAQAQNHTEGSHEDESDNIPDKNESAEKDIPIAPIQESFERWQRTAPKVEFEEDIAWAEDKEFEERMNPDTEEPWEEIPVKSAYDFSMTESEAREAVAKVLFNDIGDRQLEIVSSLDYLDEYSLPVEVVEIHLPPDDDENALGEAVVIPWWHVLEEESVPDDCPFPENEKLTVHLERNVLNDVFIGMKMEANLKRLGSLDRSGNKGVMVFDHVTRIMCSFYINSSPTGD
ncbi:Argonaute siRNA chaperone complex subunit Arb1-domain-containing protein [Lipomyces kononenkoae]|uniref:Argonaute siRNA chaperone complex subunit Arb1-domain-containing protein n=1 Tax=Lipomyces kononenkoae TaxID=34357 RepID=A0ACC3T5J0_LIPKO